MNELLKDFLIAFFPMFVAMDCIGVLPLYISLTGKATAEHKLRVLRQATTTGAIFGVIVTLLGMKLFKFLGITVQDFMVGGGIILLILSITDLLFSERSRSASELGVVPLGIPLIVGPSVLTTLVLQAEQVGLAATLVSFILNILITYFVFRSASWFVRLMGEAGTQAVSKVANLFLAAIAIMLIRRGIVETIQISFP